ncbi:MAG: RdgB/HAM1 family non-canonical purine NTP pyrophosphatase [Candidatus Eremiobacteraeota bacterium]|nr:RdgB/HAM1 family non-canonical purine NTP pyrophosphatase [Candidatus Eremiobacteraeota bacterium]
MKTYVATKNSDKLRELRELFAGSELEVEAYPLYIEVEETASDYAANALLKARGLKAQLGVIALETAVIADDSGIEVDALDGRPGVFSARYGGDIAWPARLTMLLSELDSVPDERRGARFVCTMALFQPDGTIVQSHGEVPGFVARQPVGENGFGYDPIFYYPPLKKTFGEISAQEKNRLSHRYRACQSMLTALRST